MGERSDPLCGLKAFSIAGRTKSVRERCKGMTDSERQWRAQFLKDQILAEEEPKFVPEYYKYTTNVFRRLWKTPMMKLERTLEPMLGLDRALIVRHVIGKTSFMIALVYIGYYYVKYTSNDWTRFFCAEVFVNVPQIRPYDPDRPSLFLKTANGYYDQGFYSSPFAKKIEKPPPPPPPAVKLSEDGTPIC